MNAFTPTIERLRVTPGTIGIIGSGAMGSGIAQVAAAAGNHVVLIDQDATALDRSAAALKKVMDRLVEKGRMTADDAAALQSRVVRTTSMEALAPCALVIEAIVERLDVKQSVFAEVESVVGADAVLATNTSSLSVTAIARVLRVPERMVGLHFFNPAPLMPLVEVIPALQTEEGLAEACVELMASWGKSPALAKDTPGFIVNRVARPFYGEALRIVEEGIADMATVDEAMRAAGFRMGPFELMDFIGNDVNYAVTESVFAAMYFDPRYRPSLVQKRHAEAHWLGRKTGRGYYDYREGAVRPVPVVDHDLHRRIQDRVLAMLVNEAFDAVHMNICSETDVETAMTRGVNYPKGLLAWGRERGLGVTVAELDALSARYGEDRYRCCPLLREAAAQEA
jgi:3-hydroxybutyryl-CoA dehydrogenase